MLHNINPARGPQPLKMEIHALFWMLLLFQLSVVNPVTSRVIHSLVNTRGSHTKAIPVSRTIQATIIKSTAKVRIKERTVHRNRAIQPIISGGNLV